LYDLTQEKVDTELSIFKFFGCPIDETKKDLMPKVSGKHTPVVTPDEFTKHLGECSSIVRTWPKWKQDLLGGAAHEGSTDD